MENSDICVDIIVPVYNVAPYVTECLDTIRQQSHANFVCILVDDGSVDGSKDICSAYVASDNRFQLISQENAGVVKARLKGLEAAKHDWVTFVDPDDYLSVDYLDKLVKAQVASQADFVVGQYYEFNKIGDTYQEHKVKRTACGDFNKKEIEELYKTKVLFDEATGNAALPLFPWAKLLSRNLAIQALKQTIGFVFAEDLIANLYMFQRIDKLCVISDAIYYYRVDREGQASRQKDMRKMLNERLKCWEKISEIDPNGWLKSQQRSLMWSALRGISSAFSKQVAYTEFHQAIQPVLNSSFYKEMVLDNIKESAITKADYVRLLLLKCGMIRPYYLLHKYIL